MIAPIAQVCYKVRNDDFLPGLVPFLSQIRVELIVSTFDLNVYIGNNCR